MIIILILLLLLFGGISVTFSCLGTLLAVALIVAIAFLAAWLFFYAGVILLLVWVVMAIWRWLISDHPQLVQRLKLDRVAAWFNQLSRQQLFALFLIGLLLIWLIHK